MNKAGQDVIVKSSDNNPAQGWKVKKGFMMDITKGTTSAQPVTLAATSTDSKTPLAVNGTTEMHITPHATKGNTKDVVVLGTQRELVMVYLVCVLRSALLEELIYFHCVNLLPLLMVFTLLSILHAKLGTLPKNISDASWKHSSFRPDR